MPSAPGRFGKIDGMRDARFLVLFVLQAGAGIVLGIVAIRWGGPVLWLRVTGAAIAAVSCVLMIAARFQLGRSFAVTAQAKELVVRGLYAKIRNPIYVFGGLLLFGMAVAVQRPFLFLLFLVLVPLQILRARREARVLEEKFGDRYRAYRAATWF